jgi:probable rRNA maturation factor
MAVFFFNEDTDFHLDDESTTVKWIQAVLSSEGYNDKNLNYIFCSDEYLLQINQEYLEHNTYTDIITFDNTEEDYNLEADIFISIERVEENAGKLGKSFAEELHRVMIHGLLHIMGYSDKTPDEKQSMREKEDACLSLR